jgi:hypothetical protein
MTANVWWALGLLLFGAWWTLFLHELAHLVVMKATGATITIFKPYWHFDALRWFWFGYVGCTWPDQIPAGYRFSHVAPAVKSAALLTLWGLLAWFVWWPFAGLAVCEFVDHVWWWFGSWSPRKDAYQWWHRDTIVQG